MAATKSVIESLLWAFRSQPLQRALAFKLYSAGKPKGWIHRLDDEGLEEELSLWYLAERGERMDFRNPRTFSEKSQWLKVYDRDPRKTKLSDKLGVRETIAEEAGEKALPEVYRIWRSAADIDFAGLPESFILKCNNGSGMMMRIEDSEHADMKLVRKNAREWLSCDFAAKFFELQYADIEPAVYAEEWIEDIEWEYQAWCFSGKTEFIAAIHEPHGKNEKQFFSPDWEKLPFVSSQPEYKGNVARPECLEQIIEHSEHLAKGFIFVRVDWYGTRHGLMFSEMSFTPACGLVRWDPSEYNLKTGELIHLPCEG